MKQHGQWMFYLMVLMVLCLFQSNRAQKGDDFVSVDGVKFSFNGVPFYVNGFNSYWLMTLASDPNQRSKVIEVFVQAQQYGLTVARTMAYSDGPGAFSLQPSPGQYNEKLFQGMDFVVAKAREYGIRLVMSLVDNFADLGGKQQYVAWARSKGAAVSSDDDFFRNDICKKLYKNHVKTMLTRMNTITKVAYKDDPTIMAWELINEPRCPSDLSGQTLHDWITEMASFLKSIDSKHLLEIGMEGFYGPSTPERLVADKSYFQVGTDYIKNNKIKGIDFTTVHSYPDEWYAGSGDEVQLRFLQDWINNHTQDAHNILKMPVLFAEFGTSYKKPGFSIAKRDQVFKSMYSAIYSSASSGGAAAGSLFWQLMATGMTNYGDGYDIVLDESSSTASIIGQQSRKLERIRRKLYMKKLKAKRDELLG